MYQFKECTKSGKEVEKILCNLCKKEIEIVNGIPEEDVLSVEKRWGYFSNKDNEIHRFDLCESCYDKLINEFGIPVEIE